MTEICSVQSQSDKFKRHIDKMPNANLSYVIDNMSNLSLENTNSSCNGLVFNNGKDNFVLTCNHVNLSDHLKYCNVIISNETYECEVFFSIKELDIVILKFESRITHGLTISDYTPNTNISLDNLTLRVHNKKINILNYFLDNLHVKSQLFPTVPTLCIRIKESIKIEGLSGGIVTNSSNVPIAIVVCKNELSKNIECLYLPFVLSFIEKMIRLNITSVKGIHVNTADCEIEYNGKDINGNYVVEDSCNYPNGRKEFKFKKDDIIISVNDQQIKRDGYINCSDVLGFNIDVPMTTYLMLITTICECASIKLIRPTENDMTDKEYLINGICYHNIFTNQSYDNLKRVIWKGFIFVEMSEELLFNYEKQGYSMSKQITKTVKSYYDGTSNVVLLDIEPSKVPQKYSKLSFPLKDDDGYYCVLNLEKIGQKKIKNLDDLYDILNSYKTSLATFTFHVKGNIKNDDEFKIVV